MSMILEALRKSEAERQRGRAPGLFVEQRPARPEKRRVPAWAWVMGVAMLVLLLTQGWREWERSAVMIAPTTERAADPVTEARPTQFTPRTEPAPGAPGEPGALTPITLAPAPQPTPPAPASIAVAPAQAPAPAPSPVAIAPTGPPAAPSAAPSSASLTAAPTAMMPPRSEAIGAPQPEPAPPAEPMATLPGLNALSATDRAVLPPLKLSMHVYADTPAQRFVILDGQRLGEGASPANGVVLEEIRRDGLVLSVNGQRLLLARP
jgi:general secretion pathway protein B